MLELQVAQGSCSLSFRRGLEEPLGCSFGVCRGSPGPWGNEREVLGLCLEPWEWAPLTLLWKCPAEETGISRTPAKILGSGSGL